MQTGLVGRTSLLLREKVVLSIASSTLQFPSLTVYLTLADFTPLSCLCKNTILIFFLLLMHCSLNS